jgi:hypothetical protein
MLHRPPFMHHVYSEWQCRPRMLDSKQDRHTDAGPSLFLLLCVSTSCYEQTGLLMYLALNAKPRLSCLLSLQYIGVGHTAGTYA